MTFVPKKTKDKFDSVNKSLYIRQETVDKIDAIAAEHNTSFNNVVISMIEKCLEED